MHDEAKQKDNGKRFITEDEVPEKKKTGWRKFLADWDFVIAAAVVAAVIIVLRMWVVLYAYVPTGSMIPLIPIDARLLADRNAYCSSEIERGDIVVFFSEKTGSEEYLVKRVIGLPGETVTLADGQVYINGALLDESEYVNGKTMPTNGRTEFVVPEGHYLMMGDNRTKSWDSRGWAEPYIAKEEIEGQVFVIFKISDWYFRWVG